MLVIGLLAGGGAVGAAWGLSGGGRTGTSAPADDARDACRALDRLDEAKLKTNGSEFDVAIYRLAGATDLSASAAAGDRRYKPLAEAVLRVMSGYERSHDIDKEGKRDLQKARDICAGL
ncbi:MULTISPECIES: hypothetical protein [unclassified Streptomyces]|uniref:hypothetical protein n=1 Tax=unclassified Streptomyces TaxID=2593676 RepID=UPI0033F19F3F